jgi:hypothetical protein
MPFDATSYDTLADIDKTKPLSVESVKRIVRAVRDARLLAMDHVEELRGRFYSYPDRMPYFTPHRAVDAFLGADARSSCPCNLKGDARRFLVLLLAVFFRLERRMADIGNEVIGLLIHQALEARRQALIVVLTMRRIAVVHTWV